MLLASAGRSASWCSSVLPHAACAVLNRTLPQAASRTACCSPTSCPWPRAARWCPRCRRSTGGWCALREGWGRPECVGGGLESGPRCRCLCHPARDSSSQLSASALCTAPCTACSYVYDGELEAQMTMTHDANKQLLKARPAGGGAQPLCGSLRCAARAAVCVRPCAARPPPDDADHAIPAPRVACGVAAGGRHLPGSGAAQERRVHDSRGAASRRRRAARPPQGKCKWLRVAYFSSLFSCQWTWLLLAAV